MVKRNQKTPPFPFDALQRLRNAVYYPKRGLRLYRDFKTFGDCAKISHANAVDFYACARRRWPSGPLQVYEVGIGNAGHALHFLEKLRELDPSFCNRVIYTLCDISEKLLRAGAKKLSRFRVRTRCGSAETLDITGAHYIRSLEMFDDLPAKIFTRGANGVSEVYFSGTGKPVTLRLCRDSAIASFMACMPLGYYLPINRLAAQCLERWHSALAGWGYIDLFDYGFAAVTDITCYPPKIWNETMVREFNRQLTVDVNFLWLRHRLHSLQVQPQKSYVETVLGQRMYYVEQDQLDYLTVSEIQARRKELKRYGYDPGFFSYGEEKDDYFHGRMIKF